MLSYFARVDSNSANNPALNLTGDPSIELSFTGRFPDGSKGDLILEQPAPDTADPDTFVEINGTTYDFVFELSGTMPTLKKDGAQQVPDQYEGNQVVIITVLDYPTAGEETRFAFMPGTDASAIDMDSFGNGAIDVQGVDYTPSPVPVCFVRGTLISTPNGEIPVEQLSEGDKVLTADSGAVGIEWISCSRYSFHELLMNHRLRPVCIRKGSLGAGMPSQDLWVSQRHRVLLTGAGVELVTGEFEALAAAKYLAQPDLQSLARFRNGVEYYHLMLPAHQLIRSNGLLTESFYPGPAALNSVGQKARELLANLHPEWEEHPDQVWPSLARPEVDRREATTIQSFSRLARAA